jgi:hypothetical protein
MVRHLAGFAAWMMMAAAALGCGAGVSAEEAKQRCDQARKAEGLQCVPDAAYQQCRSCQEECGDGCQTAESCPVQFLCSK